MSRLLVVIVAALLPVLSGRAAPLHHDLTVSLDPAKRHLHVTDRIRIGAGHAVVLQLAARFRVEQLLLDGRAITAERAGTDATQTWRVNVRAPADRTAVLDVRYAGELDALEPALDHRQVLGIARPIAGAQGAFLAANTGWYLDGERELHTYRMQVTVPAGFRPVAPGRVLAETKTASSFVAIFVADDPLPGIDLIAGPYTVAERIVHLAPSRAVRVRTYFHQELDELAAAYLDSVVAYLKRYDESIGPYAFASYSVVSSPLPTGLGMPGIAYLGKQVLRLPFIRSTSLGHEVLHDWWGNGVYPDYARGNWSEGLTTFLADYAFKEDEGAAQAQAMRLGWLRDYAAVRSEHDRPLSAFVARRHGADQAVGYNKTAFVLFMLRELIGEGRFRSGLRRFWSEHRFRYASWDDLRRAFEASAGRDLRFFFTQWISRAGAPELDIASTRLASVDGRQRLMVELRQSGAAYQLNVPLRVHLETGASLDLVASISGAITRLSLDLPARAQSLSIDPEARIFRRLDRQEVAPILREVMLDKRVELVSTGTDANVRKTAHALATAMLEHAPRTWQGASIDRAPPLLIIGLHANVADFLARHAMPGPPGELKERGTALAYARRSAAGNAYVVVSARDNDALGALARPLPHLGAQSFAVFEGGRSIERGIWSIEPRRYAITD